jgi:hypothetical protein
VVAVVLASLVAALVFASLVLASLALASPVVGWPLPVPSLPVGSGRPVLSDMSVVTGAAVAFVSLVVLVSRAVSAEEQAARDRRSRESVGREVMISGGVSGG